MHPETAFTHFFATSILSSLFTIATERFFVASLSPELVLLATSLAISVPLVSHILTFLAIKSSQNDAESTFANPPDSTRTFLVSFLSCASTIERYFFLGWVAPGFRYYIYALGLIEIFVVLQLGVLFRRLFTQRSTVIEDGCEKGISEFVLQQSSEAQ